MVNNQIEFNNIYNNKETKKIKLEDEYEFKGQLIIADYLSLEKLYLHDIDKIDKVTLKNLPQLQEYKDIQEIFELSRQKDHQGLVKKCLDLKKRHEDTKKNVSFLQGLGYSAAGGNTKEILSSLEKDYKNKETKLEALKEEKLRLEKMLKLKKLKEELEILKS
ncbi:1265_t:CDS:2, partial [Cetraspora pellucida]